MLAALAVTVATVAAPAGFALAVQEAEAQKTHAATHLTAAATQAKLRSGAQETRVLAAQELSLRQAWSEK